MHQFHLHFWLHVAFSHKYLWPNFILLMKTPVIGFKDHPSPVQFHLHMTISKDPFWNKIMFTNSKWMKFGGHYSRQYIIHKVVASKKWNSIFKAGSTMHDRHTVDSYLPSFSICIYLWLYFPTFLYISTKKHRENESMVLLGYMNVFESMFLYYNVPSCDRKMHAYRVKHVLCIWTYRQCILMESI